MVLGKIFICMGVLVLLAALWGQLTLMGYFRDANDDLFDPSKLKED